MYTLGELADRLDLALSGDPQKTVTGLASLSAAGPTEVAFISSRKYLAQLTATKAGAVIIAPAYVASCPVDCLQSDNPYLSVARASTLFAEMRQPRPGIHSSAVVSSAAQIHPSATVGPQVVIEADVCLRANVIVGAGVFLGEGSKVGAGTRILPHVVIHHGVSIGENCTIHSQAVLGADGFGFAQGPQGWEKIHHLGGLRIGNGVDIGAASTIDRGALDDTVLEDGVIIDNQVQIAHNCHIGRNTAIAGCCGLAGSTIIGANCTLAGGVGVVGHVEICDNVHVTGMTMVTRSIVEPGSYSSGTSLGKTRSWLRNAVRFSQLDAIVRRLVALEQRR